eukprot:3249913-Rhodomonas_salina.1
MRMRAPQRRPRLLAKSSNSEARRSMLAAREAGGGGGEVGQGAGRGKEEEEEESGVQEQVHSERAGAHIQSQPLSSLSLSLSHQPPRAHARAVRCGVVACAMCSTETAHGTNTDVAYGASRQLRRAPPPTLCLSEAEGRAGLMMEGVAMRHTEPEVVCVCVCMCVFACVCVCVCLHAHTHCRACVCGARSRRARRSGSGAGTSGLGGGRERGARGGAEREETGRGLK